MSEIYPNRKKLRLSGFDYAEDGIYYLTICCKNMECHFGRVEFGEMHLNASGLIAQQQIFWLENQYKYVDIHNFVVMPNHVHILMEIDRNKLNSMDHSDFVRNSRNCSVQNSEWNSGGSVGNGRDRSLHETAHEHAPETAHEHAPETAHGHKNETTHKPQPPTKIKSISELIGAYKTTSSKYIHLAGNMDFIWQKSFYDHIVRSSRRYAIIDNYINENPSRWERDKLNK